MNYAKQITNVQIMDRVELELDIADDIKRHFLMTFAANDRCIANINLSMIVAFSNWKMNIRDKV